MNYSREKLGSEETGVWTRRGQGKFTVPGRTLGWGWRGFPLKQVRDRLEAPEREADGGPTLGHERAWLRRQPPSVVAPLCRHCGIVRARGLRVTPSLSSLGLSWVLVSSAKASPDSETQVLLTKPFPQHQARGANRRKGGAVGNERALVGMARWVVSVLLRHSRKVFHLTVMVNEGTLRAQAAASCLGGSDPHGWWDLSAAAATAKLLEVSPSLSSAEALLLVRLLPSLPSPFSKAHSCLEEGAGARSPLTLD